MRYQSRRTAAGLAAALLSAGLAPAAAMAALWYSENIAGWPFGMTSAVALAHAILLGLPLFLIFQSKGWVNAVTCVVAGFVIGAAPAVVLSWSAQHPQGAAAALMVEWARFLMPPTFFGMFGALGGAAFWLVLSSFEVTEESVVAVRFLQSRRIRA